MSERWETVEEISAARRRFEESLPGWRRPAAYGVGRPGGADGIEFVRVNDGEHPLPAAVLATVCGYRSTTGSFRLSKAELSRAIDLLAPAEACTAYEHPNLWAWRELRDALPEDHEGAAVFIADWDAPSDDPHIKALRKALGR